MNIFSEFFGVNLKETPRIQMRINEPEIKYKPYLYLIRFLLFCEKNLISSKNIRIIYIDSTFSLHYHLIKLRFSNYASSIYIISAICGKIEVIDIPSNPELFTIYISDSIKTMRQHCRKTNCDIEVCLIAHETSFYN